MDASAASAAAAAPEQHTRPEKRQRLDDASGADDEQQPPPPGPPAAEQLTGALRKIASHISNSAKFPKASALLRQVLDAVTKAHSDELFAAVKAAFTHPEHCTDPLLRKDYARLIKAVSLRAEGVLSRQQRAQLEVYSILAVMQNELWTDDSFVFNKVIGKIKAAIQELPEGDEEQEAAWLELFPQQAAALGIAAQPRAAAAAAAAAGGGRGAAAAAAAAKDEVEADPFGLDDFIAKAEAAEAAAAATEPAAADAAGLSIGGKPDAPPPAPQAAAAAAASTPAEPPLTWDAVSCLVMRKQALLSCIETAKTHMHKLAWARTSVEMLIEDVAKPAAQGGCAGRFVGGQKQQLQELLKFVNAERAARRSGVNRRPGGKGTGEYQTAFEKARAEWGSADWVSARGKVGGQGDGSQFAWLG